MAGTVKEEAVKLRQNLDKVYKAGEKSEYDRFWDVFQENGERTDYNGVFYGYGWTAETFKPKYDIHGTRFQNSFAMATSLKGSLIEMLNACGVTIDTSQATNVSAMYYYCTKLTEVPHIDMSSVTTNVGNLLNTCRSLVRVEKVTYTENAGCYNNVAYQQCTALTDIEIAGVIAGNMNLQWSPLSPASMKSIITHLKNLTGTGKENTLTLTFSEDCWTALEADSTAPGDITWKDYVKLVLGWNV